MDANQILEDATKDIRYQPKMDATWITEFNTLEHHTEKDRQFIVRCIEGRMWSVTREGEPPKDSAYWLNCHKEYMVKYQQTCRAYYAPNTDKRTKQFRQLKADMTLYGCFITICELYYRRELKREGKPDALPNV